MFLYTNAGVVVSPLSEEISAEYLNISKFSEIVILFAIWWIYSKFTSNI